MSNSVTVRIDLERFEHALAAKCWDVSDLEAASGVHRTTIYAIRAGKTAPARRTIRKIAQALDVEIADLTEVVVHS